MNQNDFSKYVNKRPESNCCQAHCDPQSYELRVSLITHPSFGISKIGQGGEEFP